MDTPMKTYTKIKLLLEAISPRIPATNSELVSKIELGMQACFEYYNPKLDSDVKKLRVRYKGRGVTWYGFPEQMIVIHKDYVDGMWGNIYNPDKIKYLVRMIRNSEDYIEIECSYAKGTYITFTDIKEEQEAVAGKHFNETYEGKQKAASIGDTELDAYIGSEYLDDIPQGDFSEFVDFKFDILNGDDPKEIAAKVKETQGDDFDEDMMDRFKSFVSTELELRNAVKNNEGDLGEFRITLQDSHHRVMAAIEAGEEYICVNLDEDDLHLIEGHNYVKRVTTKPTEDEINSAENSDDDFDDDYDDDYDDYE